MKKKIIKILDGLIVVLSIVALASFLNFLFGEIKLKKMANYRKQEYKSKATAFNGVYKALQGNKNFDVRDTKTQQGVIETNKIMKSFLESSGVKPEKSHTKNAELVQKRFSEFRDYITGSNDDDDNDSSDSCNSCSTTSNENQSTYTYGDDDDDCIDWAIELGFVK